jgi:hypothetical protein
MFMIRPGRGWINRTGLAAGVRPRVKLKAAGLGRQAQKVDAWGGEWTREEAHTGEGEKESGADRLRMSECGADLGYNVGTGMMGFFSPRLFSLEAILAKGIGCQGLLSGRTLTPDPFGIGLTKEKRRATSITNRLRERGEMGA